MFTLDNLHGSLARLGITSFGTIFKDLDFAYKDGGRYYHTDNHVSECLTHFEVFQSKAQEPTEVELAIWFHDAVYDTLKSDNEEMSAKWAVEYLSSRNVDPNCVARIKALILATKDHQTYDIDSELLIDIDLGILGASEKAFEHYDESIRKEYYWVSEDQYKLGRTQVLRSFLNRDSIYRNLEFKERYENQARKNLENKIQQLSS